MKSRDEHIQELKQQLDTWNAKIDELEVQAKLAEMENREKYEAEIQRFKKKRDELRKTIEEMAHSGEAAFSELQRGAEQAWEALSEAYKNAKQHFKK